MEKMKKKATVEQAREAVEVCKKAGLRTHAFYVIGLPWETKETLKETLGLARELDTDFFDFNIAYPLPGTELYEIAAREKLFVEREERKAGYAHAGVRSFELNADELNKWRRRALLSLYLRPAYILRMMKKAKSGRVRRNYVRAAWGRLKSLVK